MALLLYCLSHERERLAPAILRKKPDLTATIAGDKQALHVAAEFDCDSQITPLIKAGAVVTAPDARGWLPLHCAAAANQKKARDLLMRNKTPISAVDAEGNTPLMIALLGGAVDSATVLINAEPVEEEEEEEEEEDAAVARSAGRAPRPLLMRQAPRVHR